MVLGGYKLVPRYLYKESVSFALMASSSSVVVCWQGWWMSKRHQKKAERIDAFSCFAGWRWAKRIFEVDVRTEYRLKIEVVVYEYRYEWTKHRNCGGTRR